MWFALGYIAGLVTSALIVAALAYFKSPIERFVDSTAKDLHNAGPRPRGGIYIPRDDAEVVRDRIVAENRAKGRDTNIDELR